MARKTYQIGPFVLSAGIELPYAEVEGCEPCATLSVSSDYPDPPWACEGPEGTITTAQGWWTVINSKVSSFVSSRGEIVLAPQPQEASLYAHAVCAIRNFLMQQGVMLLHGSAVARNGVATVWLGESGFGKSTAAASAVVCESAIHLSDDVVPIHVDAGGQVVTFQCDRYAHLAAPLPQKLESLGEGLPRATGIRRDGKGMYLLSPPDTAMYPIRQIIIPGFRRGKDVPVRVGAAELGVLVRSIVSVGIVQRTLGSAHLERLAAMLRQSSEGDCRAESGACWQA